MVSELKQFGTLEEIISFFKSDYYELGEEGDNCINSFKEYLAERTDYDMEKEYLENSYDKQSRGDKTLS